MSEINTSEVHIVEGVVESDPFTGYCTIRDAAQSHDPQTALKSLAGREVRLVVVPLATLAQIEQLAREAEAQGESVQVVDAPGGKKC